MKLKRHTKRERDALEAALNFARERGYVGENLPCGLRHDADHCPLAEALTQAAPGAQEGIRRWIVSASHYLPPTGHPEREGNDIHPLPPEVGQFVELFDRGRYPELEHIGV